jgi:integrase
MRFRFWRRRVEVAPSARVVRDEWLEWMLLGGTSPNTVYGYKRTTEKLLDRYPELAFADFNEEHIQGLIEDSRPASRQTIRAPFANWFGWGYRTRRIPKNPMHHVDTYRQPDPPRIDVFSDAERKILCALPEPDGTLMALLLGTGLRKSEARLVTVRRFDLERAELHVVEGAKGGHARIVPMDQELVRRMAGYFLVEGLGATDYLWPIRPGGGTKILHDRPITSPSFHGWWGRCIEAAGIPYRKPHTSDIATRRSGADVASSWTTSRCCSATWIRGRRRRSTTTRPSTTCAAGWRNSVERRTRRGERVVSGRTVGRNESGRDDAGAPEGCARRDPPHDELPACPSLQGAGDAA